MKTRHLAASLLAAMLFSGCAALPVAAGPIAGYPAATIPLTGTEGLIATQGSATVQITPQMISNYVLTSVKSFGAVGDGSTDDTAAIQAAINSGQSLYFPPGIYKTSATLNITNYSSSGVTMRGSGIGIAPVANAGGTSPGASIIRPTSAVTSALSINGSAFSCSTAPDCWITGLAIRDLQVDMTNMAAGTTAFSQTWGLDIVFDHILTVNDTGKYGLTYGPGAYTTEISNFTASAMNILGSAFPNTATTVTLVNPDLRYLTVNHIPNLTVVGGNIQPSYVSTMAKIYIAAGNPTIPAGLTCSPGCYLIVASSIGSDVNSVTFQGTDFEGAGGYPSTYNDGTHGVLSAYPVFEIISGVQQVHMVNPQQAGIYIYDPSGVTDILGTSNVAASPGNSWHNRTEFLGPLFSINGQSLYGYADRYNTLSWQLNSATGAATVKSLTGEPSTDGTILGLYNAAGSLFFSCSSNATVTNSNCAMQSGAVLEGWNAGNSSVTWSITSSTGSAVFNSQIIKPVTDGTILSLDNAAGNTFMVCSSNTTLGNSFCSVGGGADWRGFSDNLFTVQTYDFNSATGSATFTGKLSTGASTTAQASLNLPHGTAPTSPTNGDLWTTTGGLYAQINGSTVGPFGTGGGGSTGGNPTASVGLTAVNGSATTYLRSDGAPALSQSISPTWSGTHTFSNAPVLSSLTGYLYGNGAGAVTASTTVPAASVSGLSGTYAPLASPTFTGTPTVPGYLTTTSAASTYAPLASPTFTGTVTIPAGASISGFAPLASPTFTGTPTVPGYLTTASASSTYAPLASPTFTGTVTVPSGSALATPTTLTLTNATGLPISTGVSGLGTGVASALGSAVNGSGALCLVTSCTMVTPTLGVASATTINGLTPTALTTGFSVAGGTTSKTLAVSNSLTLAGTDGTTMTFPSSSSTVMTTATPGSITGRLALGSGGYLAAGSGPQLIFSYTAPSSPSAGLGSTTAVTYQSGTAAIVLTIGGTGITSTGSLTMPTASHGWLCDGEDLTTPGVVRTTGSLSTTSVTLTFYNLTGTATAPTSGDLVGLKCMGV